MPASLSPARPGPAALFARSDATVVGVVALAAAFWTPRGASLGAHLAAGSLVGLALLAGLRATGVAARSRRRIAPMAADDLGALAGGLLLGALALIALVSLAPGTLGHALRPTTPLWAAVAAVALAPAGRSLVGALARRRGSRTRVVVVGTGHMARELGDRLARSGQVTVVGHVDDEPAPGAAPGPALGPLSGLGRLCEEHSVDRVVVAFSRLHPGRTADALRELPPRVAVDIVPRYFEITGWHSVLDDLSGLTLLSLGDRQPRPGARALKRLLDCTVALVALAASLPLLAVAALAIQLESPGPVLFRQDRLGRGRARFRIVKLRTMVPDDGAQRAPRLALPGAHEWDPRITRAARLVRRLGIDELPQLLNVLRGAMSLVGPRPLVPEECVAIDDWASRRFDVRPGLTGLWQICGQHDLSFDELRRLDYQYATSWSISTDLRILLRTPGRLLHGAGGATVAPPASSTHRGHSGLAPRGGDRLTKATLLALPASQLDPAGLDGDPDQLLVPLHQARQASGD
jgi:exopolysaccharide biosynthesis polyprenyl glycosylphosphotransferase